MKRLALGLIIITSLLAACSNGTDVTTSQGEKATGVTDTSIKIGAWLPLTGGVAAHGILQQTGMNAYFEMINDNGGVNGKKIEWIVEDNAFDPQKTVAAARKLVERDKVFAVVGSNGTAQSAATFPYLLDQAKVPFLPGQGGANDWWNPVKPNLFGVQVVYENQAQALGHWAAKEGAKNIIVVHSDPAAFINVAKAVEPGVNTISKEASVNLLPVKFGTSDYAPIGLEIENKKPDAVVAILAVEELIAFSKALNRQNLDVPIYTYAPNVSNDTLELGGKAIEGLRAMSYTVPPTIDTPEVEEYREALKKYEPSAHPDFQSLYMWGVAKVFVEAINQVDGPLTRESFVQSLKSMENFENGIIPPVTFSEGDHMGVKELQPVMVENGEWNTVGDFIDPDKEW
ncbi:ABC transporter substrate-binding protein [Peribacillus sp. NPDC097224]|uniref:ABC transporter substrate-binding protein n=1 Tax=Peribacillus sp. NPDC097224 TaxID=3364399 RepID=UPI00381D6AF3